MRADTELKQISIEEFTKAADKYDAESAGIYNTCRDNYATLIDRAGAEPFETLLDAGCGTAPLIELMVQEFPDAQFTGLDLTPRMIEVARQKNLPRTTLVVGDCEALPFDDASFDVIVCAESFHHYPNPQKFFDNAARTLRPGGRLILHDYTANGAIQWLVNHVEMPLLQAIKHGDVAIRSRSDYESYAAHAGLVIESFERPKQMKCLLIARKPRA